jgi:thioredoxin 1
MAHVVLTDDNFDAEVLKSDIPVLVDFWAEWCMPCKMVEPIVDQIAQEYAGKLKIGKVDVDSNPQISMKYGIRSIPTLLIFKNGQPVDQIIGAVPKKNILQKLLPHL